MLPSPAGAALLTSEALNVLTIPAHSVIEAESVSDNDSECDGEEDDDVSDNDLEIVGEQSGTVDICIRRDRSAGQKTKMMLTDEEESFAKKFKLDVSTIDKPGQIVV